MSQLVIILNLNFDDDESALKNNNLLADDEFTLCVYMC